jgi:hypothetical protein
MCVLVRVLLRQNQQEHVCLRVTEGDHVLGGLAV